MAFSTTTIMGLKLVLVYTYGLKRAYLSTGMVIRTLARTVLSAGLSSQHKVWDAHTRIQTRVKTGIVKYKLLAGRVTISALARINLLVGRSSQH